MSKPIETIPMKWAANGNRSDTHCACCGRKLGARRVYVEVIDGGARVAHPDSPPDQHDPGYMGFFPVGTACGRRFFNGYTQAFLE